MLHTARQNSWWGDYVLFPVLVFLLGFTLNGSWLVPLRAQENATAAVGMQALAAQLCKDTVWGRFESPTLRLTVSNPKPFPVTIQFDSADFRLLIDDHEFRWRFTDTVRETTVPAEAMDHVAFVLRLDNRQWLSADDDRKASEKINRLSVLGVGHHQIKVYCKATAKNFRQPRELEAESSLEIVAERLARPLLKGIVTNHLSQPVSGAKLFLMGDGFMQVQGVLNKDFSFAELKPMYTIDSFGGTRGDLVEPNTETDAEGRFEVDPKVDTRAVLVLCDQSFPHVFLLDSFRQPADIRLPESGKLTIEFESSEDAENSRMAIYPVGNTEALYPNGYWMEPTRQDLVVSWHGSGNKAQQVTRLDYLKPGKYQISRTVMRRTPDGRNHSRVIDKRTVDICAGKLKTVRFAKRIGRAATFRLNGEMVDDFAYTTVEVYPKLSDFPFDRPAVAYDFGTSDEGGRLEMGEIEPGTYRAWVTGYTAKTDSRGRTRNQITHNGIAEFEVDGQGSLPVDVNVEMMTLAELSESSGYRLPLKCIDVDGSGLAGCTVYRTTTGFSQQNARVVSQSRTNNEGLASLNLPHGDYLFFVSTGRLGHKLFNITTPVMGQQELQLDPQPFWFGDSEMAGKVKIEIGHHETKSGLFSVKITNQMDKPLPLDQMNLYFDYIRKTQHYSAVRWNVFLEAGHPVFEKRVEAGSTTEFQLDWNKIVETAVWTYPFHTGLTEKHRKRIQNEFVVLHAGPGETFFMPKSPFEIAREATQTQTTTEPRQ